MVGVGSDVTYISRGICPIFGLIRKMQVRSVN